MNLITSIQATVSFELSRVLTFQRMSLAAVMALFPPMMVWILNNSSNLPIPEFVIAVLCGMVCLLSLLLWVTPNVYAELEGKSWTFVTTRPHGRWSILFGKFIIAAGWSFLIAWIGLTLCIIQVDHGAFVTGAEPVVIWYVFSILLGLASLVYAAVFSLFGVLIQRRAMVVAVGYFLIFEVVLAAIPANVGKITMSYHLFCLMLHWLGWVIPDQNVDPRQEFENLYGLFPAWIHVSAILAMTVTMLGLAAIVIRSREYVTLEDAQV